MGIVFERPLIQANKRSGDHTRSSSYQSPVLDHKHFVTTSLHDIVEDLITSAVCVSYQVTLGRRNGEEQAIRTISGFMSVHNASRFGDQGIVEMIIRQVFFLR